MKFFNNLALRKQDIDQIRQKYPDKIPIIVERFHSEKQLPILDKTKFLVPDVIVLGEFNKVIRLVIICILYEVFS